MIVTFRIQEAPGSVFGILARQEMQLVSDEMRPAPKIISEIRKKAPNSKIIGFKLEENQEKISEKAMNLLNKNNLDLVIGNTISGFEKNKNEIWIFNKKGKSTYKKGDKEELSDFILDSIINQ